LLVEEGRQNLWNNSNDFTVWTKQTSSPGVVGVATTTATTSPDGTFNAYRYFVEAGGGSFYSIFRGVAGISSNTSYCFSVFAKAGEISSIVLIVFDGVGTSSGISFNLNTGSAGVAFNGSNTTIGAGTTITNYGNGWYRCAVVFSSTISGNGFQFKTDLPGPPSVGQGLFVYGAQLEQGSFPTSYIPTVASTVTRTADNASMTGSNFSSWFNPNEGTVYCSGKLGSSALESSILTISSAPSSPSNILRYTYVPGTTFSTTRWLGIRSSSTIFDSLGFNQEKIPVRSNFKVSGCYKLNDFSSVLNGGPVFSNTVGGEVPIVNRLHIADNNGFTSFLNGTISQLTYYPSRLSNTQIQTLTK
jgi:hypothetical protein